MLYMVIERFKPGAAPAIYARLRERGRGNPPGLRYVSSWIDHDFTRCFQIMETDTPSLFDEWTRSWADLVDFEIIAVRDSATAAAMIQAQDDG